MSKTTKLRVYSAMTEEQTQRHFAADAVEAEHEGYVPIAQSWDGVTLTVTYDQLGQGVPTGPFSHSRPGGARLGSRLRRLVGLATPI